MITPREIKTDKACPYIRSTAEGTHHCALAAAPQGEQEPVARVEVMNTGGNAGLATRIVEIDAPLRERLLPGTMLYTVPQPAPDDRLHEAARLALAFCEFCWRDVALNDFAEEQRAAVEDALRKALGDRA